MAKSDFDKTVDALTTARKFQRGRMGNRTVQDVYAKNKNDNPEADQGVRMDYGNPVDVIYSFPAGSSSRASASMEKGSNRVTVYYETTKLPESQIASIGVQEYAHQMDRNVRTSKTGRYGPRMAEAAKVMAGYGVTPLAEGESYYSGNAVDSGKYVRDPLEHTGRLDELRFLLELNDDKRDYTAEDIRKAIDGKTGDGSFDKGKRDRLKELFRFFDGSLKDKSKTYEYLSELHNRVAAAGMADHGNMADAKGGEARSDSNGGKTFSENGVDFPYETRRLSADSPAERAAMSARYVERAGKLIGEDPGKWKSYGDKYALASYLMGKSGYVDTGYGERDVRSGKSAPFRRLAEAFGLKLEDEKLVRTYKDGTPYVVRPGKAGGSSETLSLDRNGRPVKSVRSEDGTMMYPRSYDDSGMEIFTGYDGKGNPQLVQSFEKRDDGGLEILFNGRSDASPFEFISRDAEPDWGSDWEGADLWGKNMPWNRAAEVRQDAKGGDNGEETQAEAPVQEPSQEAPAGGPRIAVNPAVFHDKRDALCVAMNEAYRVVMETNGFDPVSEPTDRQREFFADTAYGEDDLMLRRTILARICTFDTSVGDPTDEQLQEAVEFLETVMEIGAPQNEWEQSVVQRTRDILEKSVGMPRKERAPENPAPTQGGTNENAGGGTASENEFVKAWEEQQKKKDEEEKNRRPAAERGDDGFYRDSSGRIVSERTAQAEIDKAFDEKQKSEQDEQKAQSDAMAEFDKGFKVGFGNNDDNNRLFDEINKKYGGALGRAVHGTDEEQAAGAAQRAAQTGDVEGIVTSDNDDDDGAWAVLSKGSRKALETHSDGVD